MRLALIALLSVSILAGCGATKRVFGQDDRVYFEDMYFPARVSSDKENRQSFVASVDGIEQSLEQAREAGRYEGNKYCIDHFGSSDIDWVDGPDVADAELKIIEGKLHLAGRCRG